MENTWKAFFDPHGQFLIHQEKELLEIFSGFETKNKYRILDPDQQTLGYILENSKGIGAFFLRMILRSHRPLKITIFDTHQTPVLEIERPFFWLFSSLFVKDLTGQVIAEVHRRFVPFKKVYDLKAEHGRTFARIKAGFFRIWKFPIYDQTEQEVGVIQKNWGGVLKEVFTDADKYMAQGPSTWSAVEKAALLGAAVSIDFDFFEDNQRR